MIHRAGSWPLLVAAGALFLLAFAWARSRSTFLAIERDPAPARALAAQHAVPIADVLALRDLLGIEATTDRLAVAVGVYAAQRPRTGEPLAAILATGAVAATVDAIESALQNAPEPAAAWRNFAVTAAALPGLRFLEVRRRFAERAASRD